MHDRTKSGLKVAHDNDTWRIFGTGVVREDGKTYCHLASETRGRQKQNGWVPIQIADWIGLAVAVYGHDPITSYYEDRASSGQSPLEAHR